MHTRCPLASVCGGRRAGHGWRCEVRVEVRVDVVLLKPGSKGRQRPEALSPLFVRAGRPGLASAHSAHGGMPMGDKKARDEGVTGVARVERISMGHGESHESSACPWAWSARAGACPCTWPFGPCPGPG
jgi:hypothetical protein